MSIVPHTIDNGRVLPQIHARVLTVT